MLETALFDLRITRALKRTAPNLMRTDYSGLSAAGCTDEAIGDSANGLSFYIAAAWLIGGCKDADGNTLMPWQPFYDVREERDGIIKFAHTENEATQ